MISGIAPADIAIGQSPKAVVFTHGKTRLYRYERETPPQFGPVLIVYGLVGRHAMADLEPDRSLVQRLLAAGADLHLIDWGTVTRADQHRDFDDFIEGDLAAVMSYLGPSALVGICEGGVFATIYAALHPDQVTALVPIITPIDFHADRAAGEEGLLGLWARSLSAEDIDQLIAADGNLAGDVLGAAFQMISPGKTFEKYQFGLADVAEDPAGARTFLRMEAWLADRPDHPGAAARRWLVDLYHENQLARGEFLIGEAAVDLRRIKAPILNIFGAHDRIIPPPQSRALGELVSAPYAELEAPAGHVGVVVSSACQELVGSRLGGWLAGQMGAG